MLLFNLEHVAYRDFGKYLAPLQLLEEGLWFEHRFRSMNTRFYTPFSHPDGGDGWSHTRWQSPLTSEGSQPIRKLFQHWTAGLELGTKVSSKNAAALTVPFRNTIAIGVDFHPVIADEPDHILKRQGFVQAKLALENRSFFRFDAP